jgi:hypothetical protein
MDGGQREMKAVGGLGFLYHTSAAVSGQLAIANRL